MSWVEVGKEIIKLGCPLLGFTIGSQSGSSISKRISKLLGCDNNSPENVINKINNDKDSYEKLKNFELKNKLELEKLHVKNIIDQNEIELSKINHEFDDVESARQMEIKLNSWVPEVLTVTILLSLCASLAMLFMIQIPEGNKSLIFGIIALFGWLFLICCRFWFGGNIPSLQDITNIRKR